MRNTAGEVTYHESRVTEDVPPARRDVWGAGISGAVKPYGFRLDETDRDAVTVRRLVVVRDRVAFSVEGAGGVTAQSRVEHSVRHDGVEVLRKVFYSRVADDQTLVAPALLVTMLFALYPVMDSLWLSLHNIYIGLPQLGSPFVGPDNYLTLVRDPVGQQALAVTFAFVVLSTLLELACGLIIALVKSFSQEMTVTGLLLHSLLPCAIGYYLPRYWVNKRVNQRQTEIIQGFPDALDLMLVCVEAGQSLDQSIIRVGKESRIGYPSLADEFDMVAQEIKAGKERTTVLKDMSERVGVPDVASFVTTLVQSATFGTSIADALRVYSADMRDKRIMRAEEKANMLPTKLTLGTMLFTVPPLLVILIGPSVYGMVTMLTQLAGGL